MSLTIPPWLFRNAVRPLARWSFSPHASWEQQRKRGELVMRGFPRPRDIKISATHLGGVPTELLIPNSAEPDRVLLYLHGGGFVIGSPRTHRPLVARLATAMRARAYVPDYRLAPEHRFPAAFDDALAAYQALLATGCSPGSLFVAGDSAGGGLSVALAVAARDRGIPLPAALGLLCPALDWTSEALAAVPRDGREPLLTAELLARFARTFVNPTDAANPVVSPLFADLTGLCPIVIDAASDDTLYSQAGRFADRARSAAVEVHYRAHPHMTHAFQTMAGVLRQADTALDALAAELIGKAEAAG